MSGETNQLDFDAELVERLKQSKRLLGVEFYPVIIDKDSEVLAGKHREKAGFQSGQMVDTAEIAKKLQVTQRIAKELVKLHTNHQHRPSREWTQRSLLTIAEELEHSAFDSSTGICVEVARLTGFSERYVEELLPAKYKELTHRKLTIVNHELARDSESVTPKVNTVSTSAAPAAQKTEPTTTNDIIIEMIRRRDNGGTYYGLQYPLLQSIGKVGTYSHVMNAIKDGLMLPEVLHVLDVEDGASTTSARGDFEKKTVYTPSEISIGNALQLAGAPVEFNPKIYRDGEVTQDGKPKYYQVDVLVAGKVVVEAEGEGSASKDNPERDQYLVGKGLLIYHLSNASIRDHRDEEVNKILVLAGLSPKPQSAIEPTQNQTQTQTQPVYAPNPEGTKTTFWQDINCPHCNGIIYLGSVKPLPMAGLLKIMGSYDEVLGKKPRKPAAKVEVEKTLGRLEQMEA